MVFPQNLLNKNFKHFLTLFFQSATFRGNVVVVKRVGRGNAAEDLKNRDSLKELNAVRPKTYLLNCVRHCSHPKITHTHTHSYFTMINCVISDDPPSLSACYSSSEIPGKSPISVDST